MAATAGERDVIGEATLGELESTLRGRLVRPADPDYDQARAVWNAAHDRRPALIIRCAGTADVVRAVEFARSEGLQVAVRGGAHSIAGFSTSDGGVVIDTSPMKGIRVDPAGQRVVAQPGVTWSELDHETQAFGLAVTGGLVSSTGIAGFTLGGGIGWLLRRYGLTCDNLVSADVVTADGQLVTASEHEHPDLFWALRGGGGNFGVVTSLEYRLHPVGPLVFAGPVFYAAADAAAVLRGWRDLTATMPDELTTLVNILVAPPVPFLPEAVHGQMVIGVIGVYAGSVEDGTRAAQPLRTLAEPIADLMGPMPYTTMQSLLDPLWTAGANNYFTGTMLGELTDEAIETLLAQHAAGRAPVHELHLHHGGGAMAIAPAGGTAFAHRDAAYILNIIARSPDREGFKTQPAGRVRPTRRWTPGAPAATSTSPPNQDRTRSRPPTRPTPTPAWSPPRTATTRPTCSSSTRTSALRAAVDRHAHEQEYPMESIVPCPQPRCGASAQIVDRWVWPSTNGPVEHVKTWCVNGHGFTPALDSLARTAPSPPEPTVRVPVG